MKKYIHYHISDQQKFDSVDFLSIDEEIQTINEMTKSISPILKSEILISFLKDHSISKDWIKRNQELAEMASSGDLFSGNIESLFDSAKSNTGFTIELEKYLKERFTHIHETVALAN
jgi:hypothetical protein